jgi:hypothetical protein
MFTTVLASLAVAATLADGPSPPITVSLNNGGQYYRGDYAEVQFRANADGYVFLLETDQAGRIRVLFPLDPGDDNFIRGGKTYKVVGRDNRGSFYLDQAGASGMVYAAWSKSPFQFADFVRGDHWDYSIFDQYSAADDPESQLTDFVLRFTNQAFDYAIDRYIVYAIGETASTGYVGVGVAGWPWPTYYAGGWSVGLTFGYPWYDPWGWYPAYGWGWGYPGYGWGYPGYGWGYPGYCCGYPGYGYPPVGGYYPGYPGYHPGYPGYPGYPNYRPYTFKPGGTVTTVGNPYRPRGDPFAPVGSVSGSTYRARPTYGLTGTGTSRLGADASVISGKVEAGRRPTTSPTPLAPPSRSRGTQAGQPTPGNSPAGGARRPGSGQGVATPSARSNSAPSSSGAGRARGWSSDGAALPSTSGRPRISAAPPGSAPRATTSGNLGGARRSGSGSSAPAYGGGQSRAQPQGRSYGGQPQGRSPSAQPQGRSSGPPPAARSGGGSPSGGGMRPSGGGGAGRGGAPAGGGGGGRRGR